MVLDNAAIHNGADIFPILFDVFRLLSITIKFLPKYSPELNAAEFIQGFVKRDIARGGTDLAAEVTRALLKVTRIHVRNAIIHVIQQNWLQM